MARKLLDPNAREALKQMKYEIANGLNININENSDRGNFSSRENGNLGGNLGGEMTKRLVEMGEKELLK